MLLLIVLPFTHMYIYIYIIKFRWIYANDSPDKYSNISRNKINI